SGSLENSSYVIRRQIETHPLPTDKFECLAMPGLLGNHLATLSSLTSPDAPAEAPRHPPRDPITIILVFTASVFVGLLLLAALAELYLTPYLVARLRRKTNTDTIFMVNVFLGWTLVGWIVALVWAVRHDQASAQHAPRASISGLKPLDSLNRLQRLSSLRAS